MTMYGLLLSKLREVEERPVLEPTTRYLEKRCSKINYNFSDSFVATSLAS